MLEQGLTPEHMLKELLAGLEMEVLEQIPVSFACNCSKERVRKALISIPQSDIKSMIDDGEPIEVKCQFCNQAYRFDTDELQEMLARFLDQETGKES